MHGLLKRSLKEKWLKLWKTSITGFKNDWREVMSSSEGPRNCLGCGKKTTFLSLG